MSAEPEARPSEHAWPHARAPRSTLIVGFGADRANLAGWALTTGDPLADAVVADVHAGQPQAGQAVQLGIRNGLDSLVDPPDSVVALLTETERRVVHAGLVIYARALRADRITETQSVHPVA